jgi:hypothetical protein
LKNPLVPLHDYLNGKAPHRAAPLKANIWLGEICERDGVDRTAALFSESTGRVLVSVGREDDVKFVGLCEARRIPVLRIGVTDNSGHLEIQDIANCEPSRPGCCAQGHLG